MTTLFLVTDGCYSDYRVLGVYSTKEKADYAHKFYASENDVEEFALDELPEHPPGMMRYEVRMDRSGNVIGDAKRVSSVVPEWKVSDSWRPFGDGSTVVYEMWATEEQHAVKIANEQRIALIASGEFTTDWNVWIKLKRLNVNERRIKP